eukprot:2892631-Heterocapsa_arctica.AAC.1
MLPRGRVQGPRGRDGGGGMSPGSLRPLLSAGAQEGGSLRGVLPMQLLPGRLGCRHQVGVVGASTRSSFF